MHPRPLPSQRVLVTVLGFYMMLQAISTDLYLPSLPGLARTFGVPPATVALTLSVFVLVYGTMQLVLGPMSDRYGRYPALVGGLALYAGASVAAAQAPSIGILIGARAVQAIGCCGVVVAARAIVRDAYTPTAGARVLAQASSILAMGPLFGPLLGGVLEVHYGFRGAFVVLALISASLLAVTLWLRLETAPAPDPQALRPRAIARNYVTVLKSRPFRVYTLAASASYGNLFAFISGSSFVLIGVLGVPTTLYGVFFAFCVCGYLAGTFACRRLLARDGVPRAAARRVARPGGESRAVHAGGGRRPSLGGAAAADLRHLHGARRRLSLQPGRQRRPVSAPRGRRRGDVRLSADGRRRRHRNADRRHAQRHGLPAGLHDDRLRCRDLRRGPPRRRPVAGGSSRCAPWAGLRPARRAATSANAGARSTKVLPRPSGGATRPFDALRRP
ncbi:MAG: multidrug effflux MFS transporter [Betaproteobacteria bacterium]|nr:multidrug effflux MFS transporter [Betaproteobacteria bacterium]